MFRSKSFTSQQDKTSNIMMFRRMTRREKEANAEVKRMKLAQKERQRAKDNRRREAEAKRIEAD